MVKVGHLEALSPRLRPVYESIRELLAGATRDDARSRHQIGGLIGDVKKAQDKYGARAVEQLASALGTNVHTLYRCAAVSECWSPTQLEALLRRTTPQGQPLSWSHLVLLASVTSRCRRTELIDKALEGSLTVRELLVLVDAVGKGEAYRGGNGLVVLHRVVRTSERWSHAAATMLDELLAELECTSSDAGGPAELIERAIAAQEQLQGIVQKQLLRLRAERGRLLPCVERPRARQVLHDVPERLVGRDLARRSAAHDIAHEHLPDLRDDVVVADEPLLLRLEKLGALAQHALPAVDDEA
jgi:hypothetical protein